MSASKNQDSLFLLNMFWDFGQKEHFVDRKLCLRSMGGGSMGGGSMAGGSMGGGSMGGGSMGGGSMGGGSMAGGSMAFGLRSARLPHIARAALLMLSGRSSGRCCATSSFCGYETSELN